MVKCVTTITLDSELRIIATKFLKEDGISMSHFINEKLKEYVKNYRKEKEVENVSI